MSRLNPALPPYIPTSSCPPPPSPLLIAWDQPTSRPTLLDQSDEEQAQGRGGGGSLSVAFASTSTERPRTGWLSSSAADFIPQQRAWGDTSKEPRIQRLKLHVEEDPFESPIGPRDSSTSTAQSHRAENRREQRRRAKERKRAALLVHVESASSSGSDSESDVSSVPPLRPRLSDFSLLPSASTSPRPQQSKTRRRSLISDLTLVSTPSDPEFKQSPTPELTPPSTLSSPGDSPQTPALDLADPAFPLSDFSDRPIIISGPAEIAGLFRLKVDRLPFPETALRGTTKLRKPVEHLKKKAREEVFYVEGRTETETERQSREIREVIARIEAEALGDTFYDKSNQGEPDKVESEEKGREVLLVELDADAASELDPDLDSEDRPEMMVMQDDTYGEEYERERRLGFRLAAGRFGESIEDEDESLDSDYRSMSVDDLHTPDDSPGLSLFARISPLRPPQIVSPYTDLLSHPSPRAGIPTQLVITKDSLQMSVMTSWKGTEPGMARKAEIKTFLERMTRLINNIGPGEVGERRFEVELFGSVSWGGETGKSGDMDLVVRDRDLPQGYHPSLWRTAPGQENAETNRRDDRQPTVIPGLPEVYDLRTVVKHLRKGSMSDVQGIYWATTPIAKFTYPPTGYQCDVNINDLGGWYNSSLILAYCKIGPHLLRPLIHTLKLWASAQDVNDPAGSHGAATMSSYCLTLMAIGYLQHRGCLPNLQADVRVPEKDVADDMTDPDVIWVGWGKKQGVKAHVGFSPSPPRGWTSKEPDLTAADAVRGFFEYFSRVPGLGPWVDKFDQAKQVVSILNGGIMDRAHELGAQTKQAQALDRMSVPQRVEREMTMGKGNKGVQPRNWGERRMVVQDPFLWQKNCTQAMAKGGMDRWMAAVDHTHRLLASRGHSISLAEMLVNFDPLPIRPSTPGTLRGRGRGRGGSFGSIPSLNSPASVRESRFSGPSGRGSPVGRGLYRP